jgi:DNA-binding CsgD family transcriptional regulator
MAGIQQLKRGSLSTLGQLADLLPQGVILCDARARVVFANRIAQGMLAGREGLRLGPANDLCASVPAETTALRRLIQAASSPDVASRESAGAIRISHAAGQGLPLLVCPLRAARTVIRAVIFIGDHRCSIRRAQQAIRRWYGLTPTEARLATTLAEGATLEQAAAAMGVTRNTIRTHLKRVFAKTGTNRQGALVRLLLTGPGILRTPDLTQTG